MAGGGIVAFVGGGGIPESEWFLGSQEGPYAPSPPREPSDEPRRPPDDGLGGLSGLLGISPDFTKIVREADPGPEVNEAEVRAKSDKELLDAGFGNAAKAYAEKVKKYTAEDVKNIAKEGSQALAAAYFDAAASGDTTFLGSISRGLGGAARAKLSTSKELRTAQREAEKAEYELAAAQEQMGLQKTDRAEARVDKALARRDQKVARRDTLAGQNEQFRISTQTALAKVLAKRNNVKTLAEVYSPRVETAQAALDDARRNGSSVDIANAESVLAIVRDDFSKAKQAENNFDPKIKEENAIKARIQISKDKTDIDSPLGKAQEVLARAQARYNSDQVQANAAALQEAAAKVRNEEAVVWRLFGFDPAETQGAARAAPAASGGGPDLNNPPWASR